MPVTLTIKQVPDEMAARLRALAASHHRSLQGELMHTLEALLAAHEQDAAQTGAGNVARSAHARPLERPAHAPSGTSDLLAQLDSIVSGSNWGHAPLLSRDQANDRSLLREFEHLVQERQADYRR